MPRTQRTLEMILQEKRIIIVRILECLQASIMQLLLNEGRQTTIRGVMSATAHVSFI